MWEGLIKFYNATVQAITFFGGISLNGDASTELRSVRVSFTDAQTKAGPTTPIPILPAPAANQIIDIISSIVFDDNSAGAYTNVDAASFFWLVTTGGAAAISSAQVGSGFFDNGTTVVTGMPAILDGSGSTPGGTIPGMITDGVNRAGLGVDLVFDNNGMGNFTGGNVANKGSVTITYQIVTL